MLFLHVFTIQYGVFRFRFSLKPSQLTDQNEGHLRMAQLRVAAPGKSSLDGLFHGKSYDKMDDDWGNPYDFGNHHFNSHTIVNDGQWSSLSHLPLWRYNCQWSMSMFLLRSFSFKRLDWMPAHLDLADQNLACLSCIDGSGVKVNSRADSNIGVEPSLAA